MTPLLFFAVWFFSAIPVGLVLGRLLGAQDRKLCAQSIENFVHPITAHHVDYAEQGSYFFKDMSR
jgi:hypothetical protein